MHEPRKQENWRGRTVRLVRDPRRKWIVSADEGGYLRIYSGASTDASGTLNKRVRRRDVVLDSVYMGRG